MAEDIVPGLIEKIKDELEKRSAKDENLEMMLAKLASGTVNHIDSYAYSVRLGEILADVMTEVITPDVLPDGRMYFNIAERVFQEFLGDNYDKVTDYAYEVQMKLNADVGIGVQAKKPKLNQANIDSIVNRVAIEEQFQNVAWILQDPVVNFSQSNVDELVKENVDFHDELGLEPRITRHVRGNACEWCRQLGGDYRYKEAPDDIYRRHNNCRCLVEYTPGDGSKEKVW